jgi:hypothetical protein
LQKVTLNNILTASKQARGIVDRVFIHWTAGHYGQFFDDYHINIDGDGSAYASTLDFTERKSHTWRQNTGSIGIALCCAYNATTNDLGNEPPTQEQVESVAQVIAVICEGLGLPCDYNYVRTHAEQADIDEYGPATTCERWDLAILQNGDEFMSGGDILRGKANWYQENGVV